VSCERLCQFILDLIRCRDCYGLDDECILDRDEICEMMKFLAADIAVIVICNFCNLCKFRIYTLFLCFLYAVLCVQFCNKISK